MSTEIDLDPSEVAELSKLSKPELQAATDQFGVEAPKTFTKPELVRALLEDGVTASLIKEAMGAEDDEEEAPVEVEAEEAPVEDAEEELVLVKMIRANNTYQIRGYTFKREHPFCLVKEGDADYLIEKDGGFRMASPKEAREFYS